jgi:hypothetical protein
MTSCATVPTTISESAVEIRNQIASSVAMSARPTHNDARNHTFSMNGSFRESGFQVVGDLADAPRAHARRSHLPHF